MARGNTITSPEVIVRKVVEKYGGKVSKLIRSKDGREVTIVASLRKPSRTVFVVFKGVVIDSKRKAKAFEKIIENCTVFLPFKRVVASVLRIGDKVIYTMSTFKGSHPKVVDMEVLVSKKGEVSVKMQVSGDEEVVKVAKTIVDYIIRYGPELV